MDDKIALEEHLNTELNNSLWDEGGEAARNGPRYMADVEAKLMDVEERIRLMDEHGIRLTIVSLTAPGIQ